MAPALASTLFPYTTLFRSCSPSEGSGWIWPPGRDADMKGLTGKQKLGWTVITIVVLLWALGPLLSILDRKSTRLNSSHVAISYAVFCLKKKRHNVHA